MDNNKLYVIEDSPVQGPAIQKKLDEAGFEVSLFKNPDEFLVFLNELLENPGTALSAINILTDLHLCKKGDRNADYLIFELMKFSEEVKNKVHLVIMSGSIAKEEGVKLEVKFNGNIPFIGKDLLGSLDSTNLFKRIETLLEISRFSELNEAHVDTLVNLKQTLLNLPNAKLFIQELQDYIYKNFGETLNKLLEFGIITQDEMDLFLLKDVMDKDELGTMNNFHGRKNDIRSILDSSGERRVDLNEIEKLYDFIYGQFYSYQRANSPKIDDLETLLRSYIKNFNLEEINNKQIIEIDSNIFYTLIEIFREIFTNIRKYGDYETVNVKVELEGEKLHITIENEIDETKERKDKITGYGLPKIKEKCSSSNIEYYSNAQSGKYYTNISIPIKIQELQEKDESNEKPPLQGKKVYVYDHEGPESRSKEFIIGYEERYGKDNIIFTRELPEDINEILNYDIFIIHGDATEPTRKGIRTGDLRELFFKFFLKGGVCVDIGYNAGFTTTLINNDYLKNNLEYFLEDGEKGTLKGEMKKVYENLPDKLKNIDNLLKLFDKRYIQQNANLSYVEEIFSGKAD